MCILLHFLFKNIFRWYSFCTKDRFLFGIHAFFTVSRKNNCIKKNYGTFFTLVAPSLAHYSSISGDHKAICDSWIGRDLNTCYRHISHSVNRNVMFSRALPSTPWELALWFALAPLKYSERSKKWPSKSVADLTYANALLMCSKFFYPSFFVKMCQKLPWLSIRSPISLK